MHDKKWTSNASWSKIPDTQDFHYTYDEARVVCDIMLRDYTNDTPCNVRGVCLRAWVEELGIDVI